MSTFAVDATTSGNIFEKDHPIILACNRHLATILPVRMAYASGGYVAGTVIGRNSVSGFFEAYNNGASSGLDTATSILFEDVAPAVGDTLLARAIFGGQVFEAKLTGLDSAAKTDLKSRDIIDATGVTILSF